MAGMWISRLGITTMTTSTSKEEAAVSLKCNIWGSLPEDVLERVMVRLPLPTLMRMQTVCKKWRIKTRTGSFIRLCEAEGPPPRTQWFLTFGSLKATGTVCFAYDLQLSKWHTLPLGFLPFDLTPRSPLAAADGFICLGAGWPANSPRGAVPGKLVVCNPISRFWRDVPLPTQLDPAISLHSVAGIVVDRIAGTYKLIVVGEVRRLDSCHLVAYIFHSVSQLWKSYEVELDPLDSFASFLASRFGILVGHSIRAVLCSVVCEDILYCLTARPFQLHAFNVASGGWNRVKVSLPAEISGPSLVARPGRLFLVGAYRHNQHDKGNNVGIWELDQETRRWNVVDILLEAMRSRKSPPRKTGGSQDVVLFVKWASRFLAYNVSKKSWVWLPVCIPSPQDSQPHQNGSLFCAQDSQPHQNGSVFCAQDSQPYHNGYLFCPSLLLP